MTFHGSPRRFPRVRAAVLLLVPALLFQSCSTPLTAPSGSTLTLLATANLVPVDGSAEIIAVIIEGAQGASTDTTAGDIVAGVGTPVHDGTLVIFTTTLGRLVPEEAETYRGRATVKLLADGRSGTAKITAYSGAATNTIELDIGAAGATRMAVTASPQSLASPGGASVVTARVEDQQGNGVAGIPVTFTTTKGSVSATNVTTDALGYARTTLTTDATATVSATSGGAATSLVGSVQVTVS